MGNFHSSDDPSEQDRNLRFYRNEIKSSPWPGKKIEDMLLWSGNYSKLENNHNYIQWLFPLSEGRGMNSYAQPLREHEAAAIREDELARTRVIMAYRMMLDFYGMRLVDTCEGKVIRAENWRDRYNHLNRSTHNYRRITRILKSLGELGFERFQCPWIIFLMEESIIYRVLPNLNGPCMKHFIGAITDEKEKEHMYMNYLELMKKPEPELRASPRQNSYINDNTSLVEKKDDGKQQNHARAIPNGSLDELKRKVEHENDSEKSTKTSETENDIVDAVDFGPASESKVENESVPFIDGDNDEDDDARRPTHDGKVKETECDNVCNNDKFGNDDETSIDFGSVN